MNYILDDNNISNENEGHSPLAIARLKTIGSRSRVLGIIQLVILGPVCLLFIYLLTIGAQLYNSIIDALQNRPEVDLNISETMLTNILVIILLTTGLYFFAAFKLMTYGSKITEFAETGNPETFELALQNRKVYFMIIGIISLFSILYSLWAFAALVF